MEYFDYSDFTEVIKVKDLVNNRNVRDYLGGIIYKKYIKLFVDSYIELNDTEFLHLEDMLDTFTYLDYEFNKRVSDVTSIERIEDEEWGINFSYLDTGKADNYTFIYDNVNGNMYYESWIDFYENLYKQAVKLEQEKVSQNIDAFIRLPFLEKFAFDSMGKVLLEVMYDNFWDYIEKVKKADPSIYYLKSYIKNEMMDEFLEDDFEKDDFKFLVEDVFKIFLDKGKVTAKEFENLCLNYFENNLDYSIYYDRTYEYHYDRIVDRKDYWDYSSGHDFDF